jgi:UMP-CMP kinase|eukprot:CAMPEP_0169078784 /NCGR_PEP_ID=MMETSP1015-20121227/9595_1 /TAXON_ID=342587 /ORGANISM="Karlodinium micrum, Strain CCMP2283" /LENGTH=270 /DNA_ID=CAMNT_0009138395 /DNA_START=108 /DNA_END=920 /DNA_ORIENTATION=+
MQATNDYTHSVSYREEAKDADTLKALSTLLLFEGAVGPWRAASGRESSKSAESQLFSSRSQRGSRYSSPLCGDKLPKVLFVLGGPGAGKGTQCEKVIENCPSWAHISAGDCLRAALADPNSKDGEMINSYIKEGKLVPASVVVKLIQKSMDAKMQEGKPCILIDGFPRNDDNQKVWDAEIGDAVDVKGVLFFDLDEAEMEKRLIKRGETSGRADDNVEAIRKRFATYKAESLPIIECYKAQDKVFCVDASKDVDTVWESTKAIIQKVEES